jgi:hypothetical protein
MSELMFTGVVGGVDMESRAEQAKRYRKDASRYAELARTGPQDIMSDVHRRLAERYTRMAEELERREEDLTNSLAALVNKRE